MARMKAQVQAEEGAQSVSAPFLLRVAGLPVNLIEELRFPVSRSSIEQMLSLEQQLLLSKEDLVQVLHEEVNEQKEDQSLRRVLLTLKRDVFNLRPPRLYTDVLPLLSPSLRMQLERWFHLWEKLWTLQAQYEPLFQQELQERRLNLKSIANQPDLRKGILLASPLLDRALTAYQRSEAPHLNRQERTAERSLLEYLQRSTCKTSPFSTFASVSAGYFEASLAAKEPMILYQLESMEKTSVVKVNVALLSYFSAALLADQASLADLPCQITSGWRKEEGFVKYVRRTQGEGAFLNEEASAFEALHESVFSLPQGRLLQALLSLLGTGEKRRFSEIVAALSASLQTVERAVEIYLQHLLRLGFLIVPELHLDIHQRDFLSLYLQRLNQLGMATTANMADVLTTLEMELAMYARAPLEQRRDLLVNINESIAQYSASLEVGLKASVPVGQARITLPRTFFYEDATLRIQKLSANLSAWAPLLSQLKEIQAILPLFDQALERKLLTQGYFRARYGKGGCCQDLLSFAENYLQEFFEQFLENEGKRTKPEQSPQNHFNQPEIQHLKQMRCTLTDAIGQAYAQLPQGADEIVLSDAFLRDITQQSLPAPEVSTFAHTFFSQLAVVGNECLLILNQVYAGLGVMFSRFAYSLQDEEEERLTTHLRAYLHSQQPAGAVFAELKGGYETSNLNLHPPLTAYELVTPGDLSSRPPEEQILLSDLMLRDDETSGCLRLYSKRLGKEVIPLYLGFLLPVTLPEIQQVLLNFSPISLCPLNIWKNVVVSENAMSIRFYPRVRYKDLVLQRAHWQLPAQAFPQRLPGQTDASFYLDVSRWQKQYGFPARVFITPGRGANKKGSLAVQRDFFKPLALDFDSYFSVSLFEAICRNAPAGLTISEMLPQQEHCWFEHQGDRYVTEFVLDIPAWKENSDAK